MNIISLEKISEFIDDAKGKPWEYRYQLIENDSFTPWGGNMFKPSDAYIEYDCYMSHYDEIKEIQINPIESKYIGKLVANKIFDHTKDVCVVLEDLKIGYEIINYLVTIKLH